MDGSELFGDDLSDGVERTPVAWRNSVDDAVPPPILYLRRCVPGDALATPQSVRRPPKRCRGDGMHTGAPDGMRVECNYLCEPALAKRRALQRGLVARLEVYRVNEAVGWGLRTLDALRKGDLIME